MEPLETVGRIKMTISVFLTLNFWILKRKITAVIFLFIFVFGFKACVERERDLKLDTFEFLEGNEVTIQFDELHVYPMNSFFFLDENQIQHSAGYNNDPIISNGVIQISPTASVIGTNQSGGLIIKDINFQEIGVSLKEGLEAFNEALGEERYIFRNENMLTTTGRLFISRTDNEPIRIRIPRAYPIIVDIIR